MVCEEMYGFVKYGKLAAFVLKLHLLAAMRQRTHGMTFLTCFRLVILVHRVKQTCTKGTVLLQNCMVILKHNMTLHITIVSLDT